MIVQDHMTTKLITVKSNTSLWKAWEMMQTHRIRHLPVIEAKRLVGMITDRDLRQLMPSSLSPPEELERFQAWGTQVKVRGATHHIGTPRRLYPGDPRFNPGGDPDDPRSALGHGGSACAEGYHPEKTGDSETYVGAGPWDTPS
jgi:hypothetical protein